MRMEILWGKRFHAVLQLLNLVLGALVPLQNLLKLLFYSDEL